MAAGNFPKPDAADALGTDTTVSVPEAEAEPETVDAIEAEPETVDAIEAGPVLLSINGEPAVSWSAASVPFLYDADGNLPENVKVVTDE